jgi:hypothetical protein
MLQKQTKKHFRQRAREKYKKKVEHLKTDVKEAKHFFCLISLSGVLDGNVWKNIRFIIYNP